MPDTKVSQGNCESSFAFYLQHQQPGAVCFWRSPRSEVRGPRSRSSNVWRLASGVWRPASWLGVLHPYPGAIRPMAAGRGRRTGEAEGAAPLRLQGVDGGRNVTCQERRSRAATWGWPRGWRDDGAERMASAIPPRRPVTPAMKPADGRTRTGTSVKTLEPKPSASAISPHPRKIMRRRPRPPAC